MDDAAQSEAPGTQPRVAEAVMKLDEADFHARRPADLVDAKCASGEPWEMAERARSRADEGAAVRLTRAVDVSPAGPAIARTRAPQWASTARARHAEPVRDRPPSGSAERPARTTA
ncbi:hypothetical protein ACIQGZ_23025 [Streptomyces sp. NPDC092296]|uniref:hypothetical protein n=1 Tax=Streptomyces sp. NPDC092296 TaxID=3366012 RepID=UPI0037F8883C